MKGLKHLAKQRAQWAKSEAQDAARLVDVNSHFDKRDAIGSKVKVRTVQELKDMKNHTELLQELLCAVNPDDAGDYGVVDYPFVLEVYDKMHETGFLARSQHKIIADFLAEFLTLPELSANKEKINKLIAVIAWHMLQGGINSAVSADIDLLFPEHNKPINGEPPEEDMNSALARIMS